MITNRWISSLAVFLMLGEAKPHDRAVTLKGHSGPVGFLEVAPDGRSVVSATGGSSKAELTLWNITTHKAIASVTRPAATGGYSLAFRPDGKVIAWAAHEDKVITRWDVTTGKERRPLKGHRDIVSSLAYSPDGTILASGGRDRVIKLWDVATGKETTTLRGHKSWIISLHFLLGGKLLVSGSTGGTICLWDVVNRRLQTTIDTPAFLTYSIIPSPDGKTLAWEEQEVIKLWDVATGKERAAIVRVLPTRFPFAFSPDGKILAWAEQNAIKLWDVATGRVVTTIKIPSSEVWSLGFSPNGKLLVSGDGSGTITLWGITVSK